MHFSTRNPKKLTVIRVQWDMRKLFGLRGQKCIGFGHFDRKICSDYAERHALVLANLTGKFVRITRTKMHWFWSTSPENLFGLGGETCIGFGHFDRKICSYYAEFTVQFKRSLTEQIPVPDLYTPAQNWLSWWILYMTSHALFGKTGSMTSRL